MFIEHPQCTPGSIEPPLVCLLQRHTRTWTDKQVPVRVCKGLPALSPRWGRVGWDWPRGHGSRRDWSTGCTVSLRWGRVGWDGPRGVTGAGGADPRGVLLTSSGRLSRAVRWPGPHETQRLPQESSGSSQALREGRGLLAVLLGAGSWGGSRRPAALAGRPVAPALASACRLETLVVEGRGHALGRWQVTGAEQLRTQVLPHTWGARTEEQPEPPWDARPLRPGLLPPSWTSWPCMHCFLYWEYS